jgi:uncharacterized protein DUF3592
MLIEMWERLRGLDEWVETEATITAADVEKTAHTDRRGHVSYSYGSGDEISWIDESGQKHSADFKLSDDSPLYQLIGGEKVTIRFNPRNPDEYHYPELLHARFVAVRRKSLKVLAFLFALGLLIGLNILAHKPK